MKNMTTQDRTHLEQLYDRLNQFTGDGVDEMTRQVSEALDTGCMKPAVVIMLSIKVKNSF